MTKRELSSGPLHLSWTALSIIAACAVLGTLLSIMTLRNLDREEKLMEKFLTEEGLTLIRAFEAGARSSMMMQMGREGDIDTLVRETAQSDSVSHIRIIDEEGRLVASAGSWSDASERPDVKEILAAEGALTGFVTDESSRSVFEIAEAFNPVGQAGPGRQHMQRRWQQFCRMDRRPGADACRQVIYVGLYTEAFEAARREDVKHSLFMGGILFVLGSAGFYFLFLNQGMRISRNTLENMELYTKNIIESMPGGLMTLDSQGNVASCNRKTEELLGRKFKDMRGKPLEQVMRKEHCELADLLHAGQNIIDMPVECQRPDGAKLPLKVSASRLLNREQQSVGTVMVFRDMREIREMEAQVERSRRLAALGRLAAGIAHEIRNPLGTLRGFAHLFSKKFGKDDEEQEYAHLMIEEVDRLNRSISALLQFAKPREPEFQEVHINGLLEKAEKFMADDCRSRQAELQLTLAGHNDSLWSDPDLLFQAVINLMKNSLEAMEEGGTIHIGAGTTDGGTSLWVEDTGKGMTEEEQSQMFDPFFTTRKIGTGLGLANVHQMVTQLKGRIDVNSEPGKGTKVVMTFPSGRPNDGQV